MRVPSAPSSTCRGGHCPPAPARDAAKNGGCGEETADAQRSGGCGEDTAGAQCAPLQKGAVFLKKQLTNASPSGMILGQKEAGTAPPSSPPAAGEGVYMVSCPPWGVGLLWTWVPSRSRFDVFEEVRDHSKYGSSDQRGNPRPGGAPDRRGRRAAGRHVRPGGPVGGACTID